MTSDSVDSLEGPASRVDEELHLTGGLRSSKRSHS